jgi:dimethylhistidine N-methyltransferase
LSTVVELGTGNGRKLRTLLSAAGSGSSIRDIHLVDLSPAALTLACDTLAPLDRFAVTAHAKSYEMGLRAAAELFHDKGRVLVAFLGSNIGNFDPPASAQFLERIRRELRPGDALLLGADLVKRAEALVLAYDDPLGVTAAFNRNLLVRVNRDLGGNFEVEQYSHLALWDEAASRVEMHLVARSAQHVRIPGTGLEFSLRSGERIWTESSYKFQPEEIANRIEESGFRLVEQWIDLRDRFALTLGVVV